MRILIYLAVWKRPEITELCFKGIKRLQQHPDFEIEAAAVISEDEMIPLCEAYGVHWVMAENFPVGKKKNTGLQFCREFEFDFLMEIGSDDLVLNSLLDDYKKFMVKYDFFGVSELAFIDTVTADCRKHGGKDTLIGAGRMISRKALEALEWKIWTDHRNRGLDRDSVIKFYNNGIYFWQIPAGEYPKVIDMKSLVNINPFTNKGEIYNIENILVHLSEDERSFLKCLLPATRSAEWIDG